MNHPTVNKTDKNIREFTPEDTIYVNKLIAGFTYTYLCKFVSFKSGIVTGSIISVHPTHRSHLRQEKIITARTKSCYLWSKPKGGSTESCCWFDKDGFAS